MKKIILILCPLLISGMVFSQQFRVACIGNSITEGATETLNYPFILNNLLPGTYYSVSNFGVSSKTLIFGTNAWINETEKIDSIKSLVPNIVTIKLGTNDCNSNLDANTFKTDYLKLIDSVYSWSTPDVKIYLCLPIVMFTANNTYMDNIVIPTIQEISTETSLPVIDLNTPFIGHPEYCIADGIHPTAEGFNLLAELIYDGIRVDITSITINTVGNVPAEITTEGGALVFEASFEPEYASHTDIVWSMESITGDAIMGGRTIQATENGTVKVIASSPEGGPLVTDEIIVTISGQPETTGITENKTPVIFPNPSSNIIKLRGITKYDKLEVFSLNSKKVLEQNEYSETIDISSIANNTYILRITDGDKVSNYTLIKGR